MENPVLKVEGKEGSDVLFLDEQDRVTWLMADQGWYKTLFVQLSHTTLYQKTYKIYLTKDCLARDLLVACERRFPHLKDKLTHLYYKGIEVKRDEWLGEISDGASFFVKENGDNSMSNLAINKFNGGELKTDKGTIVQQEDRIKLNVSQVSGSTSPNLLQYVTVISSDDEEIDVELDDVELDDILSSWKGDLNSHLNSSSSSSRTTYVSTDTPPVLNLGDLSFDDSLLGGLNTTDGQDTDSKFPTETNWAEQQIQGMVDELQNRNQLLPPPPPADNQLPESQDVMGFPQEFFAQMGMRMSDPHPISIFSNEEPENIEIEEHNSSINIEDELLNVAYDEALQDFEIEEDNSSMNIEDSFLNHAYAFDSSMEDSSPKKENQPPKSKAQAIERALVTPEEKNSVDDENQDITTPSPIKLNVRQDKRRPNWTLKERIKLLTAVMLKMRRPSEAYNRHGINDIEINVSPVLSPDLNPRDPTSRPSDAYVTQYYRRGHPEDQSVNGGGMHRFLKEQCDKIGRSFTAVVLRRNLKKFLKEYQHQFLRRNKSKMSKK